ncbi:ATP-binding protein [Pedobacter gandavensis]|uniref:AAA family ATPase n=1 Tax=Pedobacter gandavensis TaxID=2679963 RepID=A0ABR6EQ45_9SPHI|nr:ATP-binding protein [Pedobacter gandavensis]MBB2147365.1 AAA family ATPase [Pedobacter gandavensis]
MAAILNSISFNNFFNYYGTFEDNSYELKQGVNIIVADNGAGKSKFFNAFLWLFNDVVLDSDDKIEKSIKNAFVKIISDKAKFEAPIHGKVYCGIQIEYTQANRLKYQITKSFTAIKLNEDFTNPNSWQFILNDLEVNKTDLVLPKYKPVYDEDEKIKIIDSLILPAFRKYSFLQGEEVDKIIDFSEKESIESAVTNLTDISKYEKLEEFVNYVNEKAYSDLKDQMKSNDAQSKRLNDAINEKERLELLLKQEEEKLKEWEETYSKAEKEKNELDKVYANADKRRELDDKIKPIQRRLKEKKDEFEDFLDKVNNRMFDGQFSWIAMGFENNIDKFRKMRDEYTTKHFELKALKNIDANPNNYFHFLPVNSPDAVSLQNMVDHEHCYVCDRPARRDSKEHNYITALKNRPSSGSKEVEYVKNNLNNFFGDIQINAQPFYNRISNIPSSISSFKDKEGEYIQQIDRFSAQLKSLKDQRKDLLISGEDSKANENDIINNYKGAIRQIENARTKIDDIILPKINDYKYKVKNTELEIENLSKVQDIPRGFQENFTIAKDLANATTKAKERVYDRMIKKLEEHANNHFQSLIKSNDLVGGVLKFEKTPSGAINFNYIDRAGNIVSGASEGFQRMKKFSVVMAIITANNSEYNYPLLADAPLSAFGEGFTEGFFESTAKIFPQSVILVKELFDRNDDQKLTSLGRKLRKEDFVKAMYLNTVPEGAEQKDLETKQIRLK